ncbi:RNA polymerase II-associated protein 3, partial [Frankliniella fusca]
AMSSTIELQKQIKDNAEDLRRFVSDLTSWEEEMKRKDSEARTTVPPVRNSSGKRDSCSTHTSDATEGVKKRISSSDYAAWEKFDVEKACEELDKPKSKCNPENDVEKQIKEKRLRDEANVEKEKGNQFVKKEKWDNAIECYSKAIKCYSRDAIFYCNRALCFLKKKDYKAAETDCTSALALDSTYVKALHRRGLARKELNQLDEAAVDLLRATEIEPNNTAIARDYTSVMLKIGQRNIDSMLTETIQTETIETEVDFIVDKKADPILPAKKHRLSNTTHKEPVDGNVIPSAVVWPKVDDSAVIEPVIIPPHRRSKKPLLRIQIQDYDNISTLAMETKNPVSAPSSTKSSDRPVEEIKPNYLSQIAVPSAICVKESSKPKVTLSKSESGIAPKQELSTSNAVKVVPSTPKNSVQFLAGWRQISKDSKMCYQYLQKINGGDFPKIFQDSLDGNILSQIIKILAEEFVPNKALISNYIEGLTHLEILLRHAEDHEKTPSDVIAHLRKEFEL